MKNLKHALVLVAAFVLSACGGGGGSAGTPVLGSGSGTPVLGGTGTGPGTGTTAAAYAVSVDVQRAGVSTAQVSNTETVQAVATVTSSAGTGVQGVVVTFSGGTSPPLAFLPAAATALTDASGVASVDLNSAGAGATGATTLTATAVVAGDSFVGSKAFQVSAGVGNGSAVPPAAINFVSATPSGTAIVIKGAGGNGRSESAVLQFRVVDATNAPVKAAGVAFQLNSSSGGAALQQTQAASNADGIVNVTVSSGTAPASIVVTAVVTGTAITAQSDTLIVSNSVAISGGFEIVAAKYNLDGRRTGDSTAITAYVRDAFGNPVPDGLAVNFTADYGVVATSTLGGCITANGTCTVTYRVQNPRPVDDGIATVTGTVRVGSSQQLLQKLEINIAGASGTPYLPLNPQTLQPVSKIALGSCKQSLQLLLSDGSGHSVASGTVISSQFLSTGVAVTVPNGSPVIDQLSDGFPPTSFALALDVSAALPSCVDGGIVKASGLYFTLSFQTPGGIVFTKRIDLDYPQ